jgi:peptidoglycan hydrolase FlgJ
MSISPPTDIVLDVMKAADPARLQAAKAKLNAVSANREFEAVMLRGLAEDMLPKDTSLYGAGTAGSMWRSLQADLISQEMAKAGGIGIARMLDKTQDRIGNSPDARAMNTIPAQRETADAGAKPWPYFSALDFNGGAS